MPQKKTQRLKTKHKEKKTTNRGILEEIIRVNHAGEYGATKIYDGQIVIFGKNSKIGKTIQQIKEANLIVCHASNAINFAVIFNKPVMFVTNDCLSNSVFPHNQEINYMAEQFGKNTINIDSNTIANIESYLKIDKKAYKNYLTNFIKFKGKKKIQSDIIVDQLKKNKFWQ